ncbi:2-hydroxycarboxylate transporter family protein [Fructobacillus sp. M1-13]|nr:2-hydroxycarboxylate transporter family protein [Fructobacillus papyriferae]MCD2158547.1 2-hydroxycarboxylate transporter family protein [Fructobacillus papyriferae]
MRKKTVVAAGFFEKCRQKINKIRIDGMGLFALLFVFLLMVGLNVSKQLPKNMAGAIFLMVSLGAVLYDLGHHLPIVKSYLGGGSVFTTIVSALIAWAGFVPQSALETVKGFLSTSNFLEFYIVSLVVSAIFKMDRQLILKATIRFLPVAFMTMFSVFILVGLIGQLLGLGFWHTTFFITFPMMAGGVGAGIVPLSTIYGSALGLPSGDVLSQLFPPLVLSNLLAIILAGLLVKNTKHSVWNGQGRLLRERFGTKQNLNIQPTMQPQQLLSGMMAALTLSMLARLLHALFPLVNSFAFLILLSIVLKASGLLSSEFEESAVLFGQLIVKTMTHAVLAGVGLTMLDLSALMTAFSWQLLLCVVTSILLMVLIAGFLGKIFGLYPIETAITAGLCNHSMGGTGNVAVLSAANRMNLIAFAQMGNRIGGALILAIAGLLITIFG